ncbi:MAG: hypothetical protein EBW87_06295 [Burkholderiaceae bacterium]|nr:hypothetical protein [Burkholderiaceae bacterium]
MTKNAYEIRLAILQMAHNDEAMRFQERLNSAREYTVNGVPQNHSPELVDRLFPKTEDVIRRAAELYSFVEDKKV